MEVAMAESHANWSPSCLFSDSLLTIAETELLHPLLDQSPLGLLGLMGYNDTMEQSSESSIHDLTPLSNFHSHRHSSSSMLCFDQHALQDRHALPEYDLIEWLESAGMSSPRVAAVTIEHKRPSPSIQPPSTQSNKKRHLKRDEQGEPPKRCCTRSEDPSNASRDPQSIAARNRRERISERLKILQDLVPNGSKVDIVTMLEKAISYVKFLQLQVKILATDEFWPSHGSLRDIAEVQEAMDAIISSQGSY